MLYVRARFFRAEARSKAAAGSSCLRSLDLEGAEGRLGVTARRWVRWNVA